MKYEAISMGIKSIMNAKKIILIAYEKNKSNAIKELIEGKIDNNIPCTILQKHPDVSIIIDKEAASLLKKITIILFLKYIYYILI